MRLFLTIHVRRCTTEARTSYIHNAHSPHAHMHARKCAVHRAYCSVLSAAMCCTPAVPVEAVHTCGGDTAHVCPHICVLTSTTRSKFTSIRYRLTHNHACIVQTDRTRHSILTCRRLHRHILSDLSMCSVEFSTSAAAMCCALSGPIAFHQG
jgi:hypothetical protein